MWTIYWTGYTVIIIIGLYRNYARAITFSWSLSLYDCVIEVLQKTGPAHVPIPRWQNI